MARAVQCALQTETKGTVEKMVTLELERLSLEWRTGHRLDRTQNSVDVVNSSSTDNDVESLWLNMKPALLWLPLLSPLLPLAFATETFANASDSLFWGTYRPNLYFGLKPRLPESLMTGLIWFGTHDYQSFSSKTVIEKLFVILTMMGLHRGATCMRTGRCIAELHMERTRPTRRWNPGPKRRQQ